MNPIRVLCFLKRAALAALLLTSAALAAEPVKKSYELSAGDAATTLKQFVEQSGEQVVFLVNKVRGVQTNAVKGEHTAREALNRMLAGTDLALVQDETTGALTVNRVSDLNGQWAAQAVTGETSPSRSSSSGPAPFGGAASAQTAATGATAADTVELSPFEVRADSDVGYQAVNTTSGSRLNSRLKDTPASISPFTPEFLSDIAATNLEEMLGYATNIETEFEDSNAGFNNPPGRDATGNDFKFRLRGSPGDSSRDYVESAVPVDLYNVERVEVSSGPNAILFGLGSAGGLVALSGKRANLQRDRTSLKAQFGSWDYQRYEADTNQVLVPKVLSLRLLALYQNNKHWRIYGFNDQKRLSGAVAVRPFKPTTLHVSFEKGEAANNISKGYNASDRVTLWLDANRPAADGAAIAGTTRLSQTADRFTFSEQDGRVYNLRGELQSSSRFGSTTLVPPSLNDYDVNITGPGGIRTQRFTTYQALVEQRVAKNLVLELGYFHNENLGRAQGPNLGDMFLLGDPNLTLPAIDGTAATVANPRARQLFLESTWFKDMVSIKNDIVRLSGAWEVDLGKWLGRHRIAGLLENSQQDRLRRWKDEILVDQNNVPVAVPATPEGGQNMLNRRHYVTEGVSQTYYGGDPRTPVPVYTLNGRQITSTFVAKSRAGANTHKDIDTFMLASQSFWFKERLVTTLGYRLDEILFKIGNEARVANPGDPRVQSRQVVLNEWDFDGTHTYKNYRAKTFTTGGVLHATNRLSLFYNFSKNNGAPRFDRKVLPNGGVPPPTQGKGQDYGLMIDLLGDDRYFLRATSFETMQIDDASIIPGGNNIGNDSLNNILNALLAAGKITPAQFDAQAITYDSATIDVQTKGYELEFVANPTRNLTLRLGYSYSKRQRDNFFKEIYAFFEPKYDEWRKLAAGNAALAATIETEIAGVKSDLDAQYVRQNSPFGTRPHKGNLTARYKFSEGKLKGIFVGGAFRYHGRNYISIDNARVGATGRKYWGSPMMFADAFAGYRTRLPWGKLPLTLQLNVKNLSNSYLATVGRYNDTYNGVRRVYLNEPRSYRLTTSVDF